MKDILGRELQVGDWIAYTPPIYKTSLEIGVIAKFTPTGVSVYLDNPKYTQYRSKDVIVKVTPPFEYLKNYEYPKNLLEKYPEKFKKFICGVSDK